MRRSRNQKNRNISRKDAKAAKVGWIVISTKGRIFLTSLRYLRNICAAAKIFNRSSAEDADRNRWKGTACRAPTVLCGSVVNTLSHLLVAAHLAGF
jgi:hypothetical protein